MVLGPLREMESRRRIRGQITYIYNRTPTEDLNVGSNTLSMYPTSGVHDHKCEYISNVYMHRQSQLAALCNVYALCMHTMCF